MLVFLIMMVVFFGYILMYHVYGRFIGSKIFKLDPKAPVPSRSLEDGVDYVPTRKEVIFGHHFTSIAGTGPLVGPALAVIWGWLPALIWVFVGSIVMGAVHDFGALIISMRNKGRSISFYTSKIISPRSRFLFFIIAFIELWVLMAIFGLIMAFIFYRYPASVVPVWLEIPIAILLSRMIYNRHGNIAFWSILALVLMYGSIFIGINHPFYMPSLLGIPETGIWTVILLVYAFWASIISIKTLLQPRDYINSHQLIVAMLLIAFGISISVAKGLNVVAPAVQINPAGAPPMLPFLFITIACGAISGFHALVASGTSSKQVITESDSLFVGFGAMLMEGGLATLVIIACVAGIGMGYRFESADGTVSMLHGTAAWTTHYSSWAAAEGLGSKIAAFVTGAANLISATGIPLDWAMAIMGVFVASFAGTSLDTATRIQRYICSELFTYMGFDSFRNIYISTTFAVGSAAALAFISGPTGMGALILWPLFGGVNQTLASLVLLLISVYLKRMSEGKKWLVAFIPAMFMMSMTLWALFINGVRYFQTGNWLLIVSNYSVILIVLIVAWEGLAALSQVKSGKLVESSGGNVVPEGTIIH